MIGALLSAGANIIGGLMGRDSSDKNRDAQERINAEMLADKEKDRALQREFAQSGIQWRAADAKAAGIHPVYALGGAGASYTPSAISLSAPQGDNSLGAGLAAAGQDIGRAVDATRSSNDKFTARMQALQLQRGELENTMLASQIARLNQSPTASAGMPTGNKWLIPGQGNAPLIETEPLKRTASDPAKLHQEPGAITDKGFAQTGTGLAPVPSKDVKERIEDMGLVQIPWMLRNNVLPTISPAANDPPYKAPEGQAWVYNPWYQEYRLVPDKWYRKFFRY